MEATATPPETAPEPKADAKPKTPKTGHALELDIMAKILKLLESVKDVEALIRIIDFVASAANERVQREQPPAETGGPVGPDAFALRGGRFA